MVDGWHTKTEIRREGNTAGTSDTYFFNPNGKRFRSRAEIARYFELEAAPRKSAATEAKDQERAAARAEREAGREAKLSAAAMERERREKADAAEREYQRKYPVEDSQLPSEPPLEPPLAARPTGATPQLGALPASAYGGLLLVRDFLGCLGAQG